MTLLEDTKTFLRSTGFRPEKRKGQHFLISDNVVDRIIELLNPEPDDTIIDVGAGAGIIASRLESHCNTIIALEQDRHLYNLMEIHSKPYHKIIPVLDDARYFDYSLASLEQFKNKETPLRSLKLLGNLPYYATNPILSQIQKTGPDIKKLVFLLQNEVAERIMARPGTKSMGLLTLKTLFHWNITPDMNVPEHAFIPRPKVTSKLIAATPVSPLPLPKHTAQKFFRFLAPLFHHKRKKIKNLFRHAGYNDEIILRFQYILQQHGYTLHDRPEMFPLHVWILLFKSLKENNGPE